MIHQSILINDCNPSHSYLANVSIKMLQIYVLILMRCQAYYNMKLLKQCINVESIKLYFSFQLVIYSNIKETKTIHYLLRSLIYPRAWTTPRLIPTILSSLQDEKDSCYENYKNEFATLGLLIPTTPRLIPTICTILRSMVCEIVHLDNTQYFNFYKYICHKKLVFACSLVCRLSSHKWNY